MKFGLSTLLYGGYDLDTALEGTKKAGYDGLELCSIPGMGLHIEPGHSDAYYNEMKAKVADAGLEIESLGASGDIQGAEGRARFKQMLEAAARMGAPCATTGAGGQADDEESYKKVLEAVHDITETCKATGVKMSIKAHVRNAVRNTETALRFMGDVDSDWIGINWDCTHVMREGDDPVESVKKLAPYIFTVRFRDTKPDGKGIGPIENQIPGKGVMDVEGIFAALKAMDGLEWITVEMVGSKDFELAEVQRVVEETLAWMKAH
jgi:sugar phosphate isomerase/epimerase